jgi:hypothetical protein
MPSKKKSGRAPVVHSAQICVRVEPALVANIDERARRERRGNSNMVRELLWRGLSASMAGDPK